MTKRTRNIVFIISAVAIIFITLVVVLKDSLISNDTYEINIGKFEKIVVSKGEMKSQHYQKINMPEVMMNPDLGVYYLKINDIVEEGTIVKKGDYVATLDQERIKSRLSSSNDRLENYRNYYNMSVIDSTTSLTDKRNAIKELEYDLEYKQLELEQSIYESKSYQTKKKREYDRAVRKLNMTERDYMREKIKCSSRCSYNERRVNALQEKVDKLNLAIEKSRITAPMDGMIIYATVYGRKRKIGNFVSFWSPAIAVIPDLTKLISEGYIEEIDISKIKLGDQVRVKVDALPDKEFTGEVINMSNIGKSVSGVDSKVFDVRVRINENDKEIAHGMNTTNEIITYQSDSNLVVPINYVFLDKEGSFVYLKSSKGFIKRHIKISHTNDELALISQGLEAGDVISTKQIEKVKNEE